MDDRQTQLRKGALELAVLAILSDSERYGGEVVDVLASLPGLDAGAGTVYPVLARLNRSKLVETSWRESPYGPPRKYYRLSRAGHAELVHQRAAWRQVVQAMERVLGSSVPPAAGSVQEGA